MSDDEREEEELDLTSPKVVTKYKSAADIVNRALQLVLSECKPKARIVHLCERGDAFIGEQSGNVYKKKKIERGVAFPTCISVNNVVCHFSPFASDETVLERGDMVKIDMGCHIDGFIAVLAHTHVIQEGPVTGRKADVIAAANTAAEVALRFVRPGKKNKYMTEAIQKVADAYDCKIVQGVLSHKLKRNKVLPNVSSSDTRVADAEFEENEVYAIDIVTSTGEGKPKLLDEKQTTIYKRAMERNYNLKMEASRFIFNEINQKFPIMPFTARALEENRARLGLVECVNHDLLQPYPVLHEKPGDFVAHVKLTVLLLPNGSDRVNSQPLQELQPTKTVEDPEIKAWLALATKKKKGGGKKKKAKKSCKGDEQFHAKGTESSQVDVTDSLQSNSTLECSSSKVAISDLHDDLCSSILLNLQLPLKGLGQAMLVSKQWKKVVCSTHFICEHSNANIEKDSQILVMLRDKNDIGKEVYHLYEDICRDDPLVPLGGMSRPWERRPKIDARTLVPPVSGCSSLIGTVEGVICLEINTEPRNKMVIFWNPITSRHVSLPLEKIYQVRGFGYDNRSRQFKVLSHSSLKNPPFQVGTHRLQVYPISSPFRRLSSDECYYRNVYHAGSIHWVEFAKKWRILTFDCSNDVFNTFDLPLELTTWAEDLRGEKKDLIVNSFNQSLKVYSSSFDGVKWMTQIWTMKCYGDSSSWEKEKLLSCLPNNFMVDYRQVIRREILWSIRCVRHNIVCRAKSNGSGDIIPTVNHDYHFEGLEVGVTRDFRPTIMLLDT